MTEQEAKELYDLGTALTLVQLQGCWKVTMWGWWRWMCRDEKVIWGCGGYNLYRIFKWFVFRWGRFGIFSLNERSYLFRYNHLSDFVHLHPENHDIMIGRFGWKRRDGSIKHLAYFMMERI